MMEMTDAGHGARESAAMRAMFAARKEVFIDLLGWDLPVLADRFEVDQFDTPDAEYLILLGPDHVHRASARLLRTEREHILGHLYPHLCTGIVPTGRGPASSGDRGGSCARLHMLRIFAEDGAVGIGVANQRFNLSRCAQTPLPRVAFCVDCAAAFGSSSIVAIHNTFASGALLPLARARVASTSA